MKVKGPTLVSQPPPRKIGRPRSVSTTDEPAATVHLALDADDYDYAFQRARCDDVSVPEVIRRAFKEWRARQR